MQRDRHNDGGDHAIKGGPSGNTSLLESTHEVHSWLTATSARMTPQQAACLRRGLGGVARAIAMRSPPQIANYGTTAQGAHTCPA
eukprot:3475815-Pyramimonas_sp.AAC.1